jgi:uncharacterized protein YndB with AHSA1/START domain
MDPQHALAQELLLIADLSGYTGYLSRSEPEEAPLIAGDLVETVVGGLLPSFDLASLEGDAAFLHADPSKLSGDDLLATVVATYGAFRRRVESLRLGSDCECSACRTVPQLDLKFFVHLGTVLHQRIAGRHELAGRDVILVHRLMKDSAPAQSGATSYALLTDAVVHALGIDAGVEGLLPVRQEYEHLGSIEGYVLDVRGRWEASTADAARTSTSVPFAESQREILAPPSIVWDLLTLPGARQRWEGIESIEDLSPERPPGVGTLSRCVARHLTTIEEIVEWSPPGRLARRTVVPGVGLATVAYTLEPTRGGTALTARWHPIGEEAMDIDPGLLERALGRLADVAVSR